MAERTHPRGNTARRWESSEPASSRGASRICCRSGSTTSGPMWQTAPAARGQAERQRSRPRLSLTAGPAYWGGRPIERGNGPKPQTLVVSHGALRRPETNGKERTTRPLGLWGPWSPCCPWSPWGPSRELENWKTGEPENSRTGRTAEDHFLEESRSPQAAFELHLEEPDHQPHQNPPGSLADEWRRLRAGNRGGAYAAKRL